MATRTTRQVRWRSPLTDQLEQLDSPAEPSRSASPRGDHKARDEWASAPIPIPRMDSELSKTAPSPSTPVAALQTRSGPSPRSPREPCAIQAPTEIGVEARRTATERAQESPLLRAPRVEGSTLRTAPSTAQAQALRTTLFYASLDGRFHDGIDDKHRALKPPRVRESASRAARSSKGTTHPCPGLRRDIRVALARRSEATTVHTRSGPPPRSSTCKPRRERERLDDDGHSSVSDAWHRTSRDNVEGARACAAETARDGQSARVRAVRGVVAVQSPSLSAAEDFLLVISHGTVALQTLQKPYQRLLEKPLDEVAAKVVPGRQDTFWVTTVGFEDMDSGPDAIGIFVVLRDRALRDQWLEALATAGAHVDVAGACLAASTRAASYPDAPVRWLW